MYPKNRIPMYEGDGFIHHNQIQDTAEDSCVSAPIRDSQSRAEPGPGLSGATRELLHKVAVWVGISVRDPQGKALEN